MILFFFLFLYNVGNCNHVIPEAIIAHTSFNEIIFHDINHVLITLEPFDKYLWFYSEHCTANFFMVSDFCIAIAILFQGVAQGYAFFNHPGL